MVEQTAVRFMCEMISSIRKESLNKILNLSRVLYEVEKPIIFQSLANVND